MPAHKTNRKSAADTRVRSPLRSWPQPIVRQWRPRSRQLQVPSMQPAARTRRPPQLPSRRWAMRRLGEVALDANEGAATLSLADQVAAGGELAAALSSDEFLRARSWQASPVRYRWQRSWSGHRAATTLAAFLGRTSHQLRILALEAISRATEGAVVAQGTEHLAGELAALGLTEMGQGRERICNIRGVRCRRVPRWPCQPFDRRQRGPLNWRLRRHWGWHGRRARA